MGPPAKRPPRLQPVLALLGFLAPWRSAHCPPERLAGEGLCCYLLPLPPPLPPLHSRRLPPAPCISLPTALRPAALPQRRPSWSPMPPNGGGRREQRRPRKLDPRDTSIELFKHFRLIRTLGRGNFATV